jgi:hypothetical protein
VSPISEISPESIFEPRTPARHQIESSKLRQIDLSNVSLRLSAAAPSPEPSSKTVFPAARAFFGSALSSVRAARSLLVHASLGELVSSVRAARALLVHASLGELAWAALLVLATLAGALVGTVEKRVEKRGSARHLVA